MANLYTPYANGTFETGTINFTLYRATTTSNVPVGPIAVSSEQAHSGTKSAKITVTNGFVGGPSNYRMAQSQYLRTPAGYAMNVIPLTVGKKYKATCWVYVPSGSPIASDNTLIVFGFIDLFGGSVRWEELSGSRVRMYGTGTPGEPIGSFSQVIEVNGVKVVGAIDQWVQLEFTFKERASGNRFLRLEVYTYKIGESNIPGDPSTLDLTEGGTITNEVFTGGELFFDDIMIEEIGACDLTLLSPAYSKTDESAVDANDGTITVNAATSNAPLEYQLDGGTWQISNVFTNVAPGTHTVNVRDAFACTAEIDNITILANDEPDPPDPPVGGTLTVSKQPITQPNFISWFSASGPIGFEELVCDGCCWDLPNPYRISENNGLKDKRHHYPVAALNELFTFYANFKTPLTYPNRTSLRLALINNTGLIDNNVATLKFDMITTTQYNVYCDAITLTAIDQGIYMLAIYDASNDAVLMVSVPIEVRAADWCKCFTTLFQYRNSNTIYGTRYPAVPDFLNTQRLKFYKLEFQGEGDLEQYRAVSSGQLRNVDVELDMAIVFEAYWFDDHAHRAAIVWQVHNFILLNGQSFLTKNLYKIEFNPSRTLNKGKIELYEQAFSMANRYDQLDDIIVVGSEDPLLLGDGGDFIKL